MDILLPASPESYPSIFGLFISNSTQGESLTYLDNEYAKKSIVAKWYKFWNGPHPEGTFRWDIKSHCCNPKSQEYDNPCTPSWSHLHLKLWFHVEYEAYYITVLSEIWFPMELLITTPAESVLTTTNLMVKLLQDRREEGSRTSVPFMAKDVQTIF